MGDVVLVQAFPGLPLHGRGGGAATATGAALGSSYDDIVPDVRYYVCPNSRTRAGQQDDLQRVDYRYFGLHVSGICNDIVIYDS